MTFNEFFNIAENERQSKKLEIERDFSDVLLELVNDGLISNERYAILSETALYAFERMYCIGRGK